MGGAFGALGGDISAISINPSGSSVFLNSEIGFNIDFSKESLSNDFFLSKEMIIHFVNNEMALNLDDIMSRRSRCLFLNLKESIRIKSLIRTKLRKPENPRKPYIV